MYFIEHLFIMKDNKYKYIFRRNPKSKNWCRESYYDLKYVYRDISEYYISFRDHGRRRKQSINRLLKLLKFT